MRNSNPLVHEIVGQLVGNDAPVANDFSGLAPVHTVLSFRANDPCAVTMSFRGDDTSIDWIFGRLLLADGLIWPTGDGDIFIYPVAGTDADGTKLMIRLSSPDGQAYLLFERYDIEAFLAETERMVPQADESAILMAQLTHDLDGFFGARN